MRKDIAQEFSFTDPIHKLSCCCLEKALVLIWEAGGLVDDRLGAYAFLNLM